ncbi:STAS domain-containing protein [Nocardioides sp.]|uniref:STAS domain-containing protein n=1 Tax=Nocardioides sp. TaxID=35761 RepID=UPI0026022166|nr:STAS domain-containing protein [Nocardioides sp.]MDI6908505.1 STAS domain-containing protein [Nocardioides sp.]
MRISSVHDVDGRPVVRVCGDVDLLTAPELAGHLWRLIADGNQLIEVDLAGTTFMSCRGIAVLVAAIQFAALRGQVVRVVKPSRRARQVFALGGVGRLLEPA